MGESTRSVAVVVGRGPVGDGEERNGARRGMGNRESRQSTEIGKERRRKNEKKSGMYLFNDLKYFVLFVHHSSRAVALLRRLQ